MIEPQDEACSALWIYKQLGERLGISDFSGTRMRKITLPNSLRREGFRSPKSAPVVMWTCRKNVKRLKKLEKPRLRAATRLKKSWYGIPPAVRSKSCRLPWKKTGFSGVPVWEEPPAPQSGEFSLLTGKVARQTQFGTQNNRLLKKYEDEPRLWMNAETSKARGLEHNDLVEVSSKIGKNFIRVESTQAIRPDCVYLTPGYRHLSIGLTTAYGMGASDSVLHQTFTDPISGGQALSQTFVTVKKA